MTKNRIDFGEPGALSGMNLDTITMRMELARPGRIVPIEPRANDERCAMCNQGGEAMDLVEFIRVMHEDVNNFQKYWEEGRLKDPEYFPDSMEEGDWYDQFVSFEAGE